jgi:hypothetical protein
LLQKEEIGACTEGERRNKVKIECCSSALLPGRQVGQRRFCGMDKTQSHYYRDRNQEDNQRGMIIKRSPVNQKTNFNVYLGNCQQDPDVKMLLARQILGLDLAKFGGEAIEWSRFVTTYRRTMDDCQFTGENAQILRRQSKTMCQNGAIDK